MLENLRNFFKKMGKKEEDELLPSSSDAAKERLHLVLMQDRANVSVDFLDLMKREIIDVIKKYIDVDEDGIDVRFTNQINEDGTNGAPALYANIPIVAIRNDKKSELEMKNQKSDELEAQDGKKDKSDSPEKASNLSKEKSASGTDDAGKKSTKKMEDKDSKSDTKNGKKETKSEEKITKKEDNDGKAVRKVSKKEEKDNDLEDKTGKKEENTTSKKVDSVAGRKKATTTTKRKTVSEATLKKSKV